MKTFAILFCLLFFAEKGKATEYPLQFTPNAGYRGLVVAGYSLSGNTVTGNCSYYTVHSGSGKGGGYHTVTTYYNQTCTWDLYGNLLSMAQGAPAAPTPLYKNGTQTVYALDGSGRYTGTDSNLPYGGFVNTPGSHYTWQTSNAYMVLTQSLYTFTAVMVSDGDLPLNVASVGASALAGKATVNSTNCVGQTPVGSTCSITVTYDPTKLSSATGLAYDTLTIAVTSDAGQGHNFVQSYTITVKKPVDD
uniref:Uncharacterized protein n=1 Tax=Solibacter usitatus (strain Ellin6076) TaxID=234267 RepID=Q01U41_SOLUE